MQLSRLACFMPQFHGLFRMNCVRRKNHDCAPLHFTFLKVGWILPSYLLARVRIVSYRCSRACVVAIDLTNQMTGTTSTLLCAYFVG